DVVTVLHALGEPETDIAATGDDNALVVVFQPAQLAHHRANVVARRDKEHFVVGFDNGGAFRLDGAVAAEDRRHAGVHVGHVLAPFTQSVAHQRAAVIGAHRHQLRAATGEVHHLQCPGQVDQPADVIGHHLLGADDHINRNGV